MFVLRSSQFVSVEKIDENKLQEYVKIIFQQNLPTFRDPFFGRIEDLETLKTRILSSSVRVININGPPAFGKSSLAIKLGEELLTTELIPAVRYVNTETARPLSYLCISNTKEVVQTLSKAKGNLVTSNDTKMPVDGNNSANDMCLCQWSRAIKEKVVLILDDCEHILHSRDREQFFDVIRNCFLSQKQNVVTIIVSQERLLFLNDGFFSLHIRELPLLDSQALLKHYVPNLSNEEASKLSTAVGHYPLALKVIGKLLQMEGIQYLNVLMKDLLSDKSAEVVSNRVSSDEERFNTIMDAAFKRLDEQTKLCSRYLSLFPGSTHYEMEEKILRKIIDTSCIEKVVRSSFIEDKLDGDEIRHTMHKLIRNYLRTVHPLYLKDVRLFNTSFVKFYSSYLIEAMKNSSLHGSTPSDKESYALNYLEVHNVKYFITVATAIASLNGSLLKRDTAVALGFLIQENFTGSIPKKVMFRTYQLYQEQWIFEKLCQSSSEIVCASIVWKTFTSFADRCLRGATAQNKKKCSKYFDCNDFDNSPFNYGRTFILLKNKITKKSSSDHEQVILFNKLEELFYHCKATRILRQVWHGVVKGIVPLKDILQQFWHTILDTLLTLAITAVTCFMFLSFNEYLLTYCLKLSNIFVIALLESFFLHLQLQITRLIVLFIVIGIMKFIKNIVDAVLSIFLVIFIFVYLLLFLLASQHAQKPKQLHSKMDKKENSNQGIGETLRKTFSPLLRGEWSRKRITTLICMTLIVLVIYFLCKDIISRNFVKVLVYIFYDTDTTSNNLGSAAAEL